MGKRFNYRKLDDDIRSHGWLPVDLARHARVSRMTLTRVLNGERHNPRTWKRLAEAMGFELRRYIA